MNRRWFLKTVGTGIAGLTLGTIPKVLLAGDDFVKLTVLHTNDLHCHVEPFSGGSNNGKGGMAYISGLAKQIRTENPNTLLFDAGDMFQGTPYFNYFKGELILKLMSEVGYSAGTIGNHEFDNGLIELLEPLTHANFPLINSNYDFENTILTDKFPRWKIFNNSGVKTGVYGLGIQLEGLVDKRNFGEVKYLDPLKVALETELYLKKEEQCDLVICLSHLGYDYKENKISDRIIASETKYTDLIAGGHTHTFLKEPVEVKNSLGNSVIVNQAGWGGLVLGKIDFVFERKRKLEKRAFAVNIK